MESLNFFSFVSCKKSTACLTLSEEVTIEAAWVVAFFNPAGWRNFRATVLNGLVDHVGLLYVCKL